MKMNKTIIFAFIFGLFMYFIGTTTAWPVPDPEVDTPSLPKIPQYHCLRYFKHDIHNLRRCRNQRILKPIPRE